MRTSNAILGDALAVCEVLQGAKVIIIRIVYLGVPKLSLRQTAPTCFELLLCPPLHILKRDPTLKLAQLPRSKTHRRVSHLRVIVATSVDLTRAFFWLDACNVDVCHGLGERRRGISIVVSGCMQGSPFGHE